MMEWVLSQMRHKCRKMGRREAAEEVCGLTPPVGSCVRATHSLWEARVQFLGTRTVLITPTSRVWGFSTPAHFLPALPWPPPPSPADQRYLGAFGIIMLLQYY